MNKTTFNRYFNKLIDYCNLINVKLYVSPIEADYIDFNKRSIIINSNQQLEEQLCATLHEIGHWIDYIHNSKLYKKRKVNNAVTYLPEELTPVEKKELIKMEIRAWRHVS